jgi:poly(hydroxyalkanoate) granule-associated protein
MSPTNLLTFTPEPAPARPAGSGQAGAELRRDLAAAGRKLWLAGLGVLGELVDLDAASRRWVAGLVERGRPVAERQRQAADRAAVDARGRLSRAGRRLEAEARERATATLARLGVPARQEVERLSALVDALGAKIDALAAEENRSNP